MIPYCNFKFLDAAEEELPHIEDDDDEMVSEEMKQYIEFTEHKIIIEKNSFNEEYAKLKQQEIDEKNENTIHHGHGFAIFLVCTLGKITHGEWNHWKHTRC